LLRRFALPVLGSALHLERGDQDAMIAHKTMNLLTTIRLLPLLGSLLLLSAQPPHDALAAREAAAIRGHWQELTRDPSTPYAGNPNGDVTIVEFFDYQCPDCKADEPVLEKLLASDPRLRIAHKDLPMLGPASLTAARAALAAEKQDKYEAFRLIMMSFKGPLDDSAIYVVAGAVRLDLDRLKTDMATPDIERQIAANRALATALNVAATPTFIIGDQVVEGAIDLSGFRELVARARRQ
jgi:protein-disulfide isomerase